MVERKIRPAPLTLVTRRSAKSSAKPGPATRLVPASKLFVLDTNVLMHDPTSLFRFEEHDIYLPILTLEELDSQQERRHRSRAQRAPGVALPGRARHRHARRHRGRHPAVREIGGRRHRKALPADRSDHDRAAGLARQRQGRQPDPRGRHAPAASAHQAQRHPGVEGHQHAHQGARARYRRRRLLQRQGARGHRAPLQRNARAAGGFLGPARQGDGVVAARRLHLLPDLRSARVVAARQRVPLPGEARRAASLRHGQGDHRPHRGLADAQGLHPPEEQRLGHHRAQPRAEFRAQSAHEPGRRFHFAAGPGRHGQDAADARRRSHADARVQGLFRDHHDARHGAGRRGHRVSARDRRGKDESRGWARSRTISTCSTRPTTMPASGDAPPRAT